MKNRLKAKQSRRLNVKRRVRKKISGNAQRPRLSVFKSIKQVYVQAIDDVSGVTIAAASSLEKDAAGLTKTSEQAKYVGESVAAKLIEKGVSEVVYDKSSYAYHGNVKILADAAREKGLKF
jgi:large subunit ribosomal protein L18